MSFILDTQLIHPNSNEMRFCTISIILICSITCFHLRSQNVGINTTAPEGTLHLRGASSIPFPNLRITDTLDNFARIKMETTLGGDRFWDIAASSTPGFSYLNFYFQNDTLGENLLQLFPAGGIQVHRSLTPSVRNIYYANRNEYRGTIGFTSVGFSSEDLVMVSGGQNGHVRLGTRNFARMTIDTIGRLGVGTLSPKYLADFRSADNALSGGEMQLSTQSETNFLRLFGGRQNDPNPFIAFHESDTFHLVTTSPDWTTYQRRLSMLPNGHVGLGTDKPLAELDIKTQDPDDGAALHLRNSDSTHFLRLFAGRQNLTTPILYWNHGSALEIGMTDFDDSNYRRFLSLDGQTIGVHNTGGSVFIGDGVGQMDDLADNRNVAIGSYALHQSDTGYHNVVIGDSVMHHAIGSSRENVAIGALASQNTIDASQVTAIGFQALQNNQANVNTAVGAKALMNHINGFRNTAIGHQAMVYDTSGEDNTAVGSGAMFVNYNGYNNTAVGSSALFGNRSGVNNVAIGALALAIDSTGSWNTVVGADAMSRTFRGSRNTIIGAFAGTEFFVPENEVYDGNVFIGYAAGATETQSNRLYIENSNSNAPLIYGEFNNDFLRINGKQEITGELDIAKSGVALRVDGKEAIWSNSNYFSYGFGTGHNYFAKPMRVGPIEGSTTPFANLHVVDNVGDANLTIESHSGDAVLQLAGNTNSPTNGWTIKRESSDNDMEWRYNNIKKLELTDFGNLGLGVSSPTHTFQMSGTFDHTASLNGADNYVATFRNTSNNNSVPNDGIEIVAGHTSFTGPSTNNMIRFSTPNGNLLGRIAQNSSSSVSYISTSDQRLKTNIVPTQSGLDILLKLGVYDYYWKKDIQKRNVQTGFIAQDVHETFPQAALKGGEDPNVNPWGVAPMQLIPLLVKGMQEQQTEIEDLKSQLSERVEYLVKMEEKLEALSQKIETIKRQ